MISLLRLCLKGIDKWHFNSVYTLFDSVNKHSSLNVHLVKYYKQPCANVLVLRKLRLVVVFNP